MLKRILSGVAILVLTTCFSAQAGLMQLYLSPSGGAISGTPGSTVGWGYSVTNGTTDWVVLSASSFDTTATWGTYTDYFIYNFVVLAPNGTYSQPFNSPDLTGIGSYAIDLLAGPGFLATGNIVLSFDSFNGDPNNGGTQTGFSDTIGAPASVTVMDANAVPEPATLLLLGLGIAGIGLLRRRMNRNNLV